MTQELLQKKSNSVTSRNPTGSSPSSNSTVGVKKRYDAGFFVAGGKRLLMVGVLAFPLVALSYQTPAVAQEEENPSEMARQGIDALMKALQLFIDDIPQYAAPEVNERGDIIIRRLNPDDKGAEPETNSPDEETTDT